VKTGAKRETQPRRAARASFACLLDSLVFHCGHLCDGDLSPLFNAGLKDVILGKD
jgi:hypothetical protein